MNGTILNEVLGGNCLNSSMDDGYFQFVVSLLDESEGNPALKREIGETLGLTDDFLPNQVDFLARERAYSWDLGFEEQLHEVRKRSNSIKLSYFDALDQQPPFKKQNMRMDLRDPVATVQLESGSGATTVMPVFNSPDCCCDSMNVKIGAYTKEERQILIEKFRAKKKRRVWRKQIKYDCRKRLADTRPRVKGRFVSRKEKDGNSDGDSESMNNVEAEIDMGVYDDEHDHLHSSSP